MSEGKIHVRAGREKSIRNRHPWLFSGAIYQAENAAPGEIVTVYDHNGTFLARGYWNPKSQIQVRILTWEDETIDTDWWHQRINRALTARLHAGYTMTGRIINAENDFLPGLIVDRYGDYLVLQALTLHIDQRKTDIAEHLVAVFAAHEIPIRGIYERSDVDVRGKEGLRASRGVIWGQEPPDLLSVTDRETTRLIDIQHGHKTGDYLDQYDNWILAADLSRQLSAIGHDVHLLNLFSYTGGFGLQADAHVVNVDSSAAALALAEQTYRRNDRAIDSAAFVEADAFTFLREALRRGEHYDMIICDPPKFAQSKQQVQRAARGYKDLNLHSFRLLRPGGHLLTFSCSGAVDADLFQKIVFGALADSGRDAQIIRHLGPGADHPVALTFPEGAYLKGLLLRVY
jgi:23S rRNA (cytosine1962-C5)-methyltransferase